jgi:hypothetical protein
MSANPALSVCRTRTIFVDYPTLQFAGASLDLNE